MVTCFLALVALPWPAYSALGGPLTAVTNMNFNGNGVTIDSFDSGDPLHSDWQTNGNYRGMNYGFYPANPMALSGDPNQAESYKRKDNAMIATGGSLTVQNANVAGYVDTAPGGLASVDSGSYVGDVNWVFSYGGTSPGNATQAVQPGHVRDDMNMVFPDVVLPTNVTWIARQESGGADTVFTNSGYYTLINPGHGGTDPCNNPIDIKTTNVVIYIPTGINYVGSYTKALNLFSNSDVTIFLGTSMNTGANAGINNFTKYAPAFAILGLPTCTFITLGGNGADTAYVYAPQANLFLGGGGTTTYDSVGAFFVYQFNFGGHINFHYDEALGRSTSLPIWINTQSKNQAVAVGSNVTFSISTGGGSPLNCRWFFNQTNLLASGTNFFLSLTNVQLTNAGSYSVVVTNLFNAVSASASLIVYTDATPVLSVLSWMTNVQFQFSIAGVTGLNYTVQASTNLVDWISLVTNTSPFSFADTNTGGFPQRFYRSIYPH